MLRCHLFYLVNLLPRQVNPDFSTFQSFLFILPLPLVRRMVTILKEYNGNQVLAIYCCIHQPIHVFFLLIVLVPSFYVMLFPNICYYVCVCVCVHPLAIPSNSEECQYTVILRFIFPLNFFHIEFVA